MIKRFTSLLFYLSLSLNLHADILGFKLGGNFWMSSDFGNVGTGYFQFEHFIPFVPNLGIQVSRVGDESLEMNNYDLFGYYEILDNSALSLDLGFGLRQFSNGKVDVGSNLIDVKNFSDTVPMLIGEASLFPDANVTVYGKIIQGYGRSDFTDLDLGFRFNWIAGTAFRLSYRAYMLDFDGLNSITEKERISGPSFGIDLDW